MQFTRIIPHNWDEIESQLLFNNPRIINPADGKPWSKVDSNFKAIRSDKLKYLWQLTTLDKNEYNLDPVVPQLQWETTANLNRKMQYGTQQFQFHRHQWMALINSTPPEWQRVLMHNDGPMAINQCVQI